MYLIAILYGAATFAYLYYLARTTPAMAAWAHRLITIGFVVHLLSVIQLFTTTGHLPITTLQESLFFLSMIIVGVFILFERIFKVVVLGSFIVPLAMLMLAVSSMMHSVNGMQAAGYAGSRIYWVHILLAFLSYAMFTVSCGASGMYLLQQHFLKKKRFGAMFHKLPAIETLDRISFYCLAIGFPLLTMAILAGIIRLELMTGRLWIWSDPKQLWSLLTWAIYAVIFYGRITIGWRGRQAALLSLAGFLVLVFSLLGSSHQLSWHP